MGKATAAALSKQNVNFNICFDNYFLNKFQSKFQWLINEVYKALISI